MNRSLSMLANDTLMILTYVGDEIKRFKQRYADRMQEHPNILAIDLTNLTTPRHYAD